MAWISFLASEALPSPSTPGSTQSPMLNRTLIVSECYFNAWYEVSSQVPQSGMMSEPWIGPVLVEPRYALTSCMAASHAKTSLLLELARAWMATGPVYSLRSLGSPERSQSLSSSWRMFQRSARGALIEFSGSLPPWGMIVGGHLSAPTMLAPLIGARGGSFLPTPTAQDYGTNKGGAAGRTGKARPSLVTMARQNRWPTMTCTDASGKPRPPRRKTLKGSGKITGGQKPGLLETIGGPLNPAWVEWLMGYPTGWTDAGPWAMPLSRRKSGKRSVTSPGSGK